MKKLFLLVFSIALLITGCGSNGGNSSNPPPVLGSPPTVSASAVDDGTGTNTYNVTIATTNATEVEMPPVIAPTSAISGVVSRAVQLQPETSYSVIARGPGGTVTYALSVNLNSIPRNKPSQPAVAAIVTGSGEITVSWPPSAISGNPSATLTYRLYVNDTLLLPTAISPYMASGLANGYSYTFKVIAVYTNATGHLFESTPGTATVYLGYDVYDVQVNVSWLLPTMYDDNTAIAPEDIARIQVAIYANDTGILPWGNVRLVSLPGATSGSFIMTVTQGQLYYFSGTAVLDNQVSAYSPPVTHTWGPATAP